MEYCCISINWYFQKSTLYDDAVLDTDKVFFKYHIFIYLFI